MKRNVGLDLLKILACLSVVSAHVTGDSDGLLNIILYYLAGCSVPIFFMVNGNLLLNKNTITYSYVIKKILNILLVVFSWNVLLYGAKFISKHEFTNPIVTSLENLIQRDYFWQFWFFGTLIIIYLVLPIIHKYFKNDKVALYLTIFFVLISLIIDLTNIVRAIQGYTIIHMHVLQTFRIWTWFSYFLLGGLMGKAYIKDILTRKITVFVNIIIVVSSSIGIVLYQCNSWANLYKSRSLEYYYDNIITLIWVNSIFLLLNRLDYSKIKYEIISIVGNNIMGIYIVHVTIIYKLQYLYGFETPFQNLVLILIVDIGSLIVSIIIGKIPFMNRLVKI